MRLTSVFAAAMLCVQPVLALAAWPPDPFTGGLPVCTVSDAQVEPLTVSDGAGGFIAVWTDVRSGAAGLYAQRISRDGTARWAAGGVRISSGNLPEFPAITADGAGGLIAAWSEYRGSFVQRNIFAQRLDSLGIRLWNPADVLVCGDGFDQSTTQVVADGTGGAIVSWLDARGGFFDLYAQRVKTNGSVAWVTNGIPVAVTPDNRSPGDMVPDGRGGAIQTWSEDVSGTQDCLAQRFDSTGTRLWAANGTPFASGAGTQWRPKAAPTLDGGAMVLWEHSATADLSAGKINSNGSLPIARAVRSGLSGAPSDVRVAADGAGGLLAMWYDSRPGAAGVYAQRATGTGGTLWAANGVRLMPYGTSTGNQIATDGAGGAIAAWLDVRSGASEVYAQRVSVSGAALWTPDGVAVARSGIDDLSAIADGAGGLFAVWSDRRVLYEAGSSDIFAQRVDPYGFNGDAAPRITQVRDVAGDQGGAVRVSWTRSHLDDTPAAVVSEYRLWRQVPVSLATSLVRQRGATTRAETAASSGALWLTPAGSQSLAWELVGAQPAAQLAAYSLVTSTTTDSTQAGHPYTVFMVEARGGTSASAPHWLSVPDSGYSVDDLAPAPPQAFTGSYAAGVAQLDWLANTEPDLAGYRLYRGVTPGFVPGPGSLVAVLTDTDYADAAGGPYFYKLTAVDVHGNESLVASLAPTGVLDAGDPASPSRLALAGAAPNPLRRSGSVRFSLSRAGRADLTVLDVAGREVAVLARGEHAAGEHVLAWDGGDASGRRLSAGLYFVRLVAEGRVLHTRVTLLD